MTNSTRKRMRITFVFLASIIISLAGCGGSDMEKLTEGRSEKLGKYLDSQLDRSAFPGIQYVVVDRDQVLFNYAGGWADIKERRPMNPTTTMMACSMTKTLTAIAILQLVEDGEIDLDEKLDHYIDFSPYGEEITIRQLLNHTSGTPNPIPLKWAHLVETHPDYNEADELQRVLTEHPDLEFVPGEKYLYSNISYWLLGMVIEKTSGEPYTEYLINEVVRPLGLSDMELGFRIASEDNHSKGYLARWSFLNLIKGFVVDRKIVGGNEGRWLHINNLYLNGPSFGGLIGSAQAFGRFLQDQLMDESVLYGSSMEKHLYNQQVDRQNEPVKMTLGWHIGDSDGARYYFKEGGGAGFHSEMRIYPDRNLASVIVVNRTNFDTKKNLNRLDKEFF